VRLEISQVESHRSGSCHVQKANDLSPVLIALVLWFAIVVQSEVHCRLPTELEVTRKGRGTYPLNKISLNTHKHQLPTEDSYGDAWRSIPDRARSICTTDTLLPLTAHFKKVFSLVNAPFSTSTSYPLTFCNRMNNATLLQTREAAYNLFLLNPLLVGPHVHVTYRLPCIREEQVDAL
jgi:hypothetical protein